MTTTYEMNEPSLEISNGILGGIGSVYFLQIFLYFLSVSLFLALFLFIFDLEIHMGWR